VTETHATTKQFVCACECECVCVCVCLCVRALCVCVCVRGYGEIEKLSASSLVVKCG
jgi:hypothetical protein